VLIDSAADAAAADAQHPSAAVVIASVDAQHAIDAEREPKPKPKPEREPEPKREPVAVAAVPGVPAVPAVPAI